MIYSGMPNDWRELQNKVAQILEECRFLVDIEKDIQTVRGSVNVDVFAQDIAHQPINTYICECKHWQSAVPKTVVHAFRTIVNDYGANWGFVISSGGFQKGAYEAAMRSNVKLLNWSEFQEIFINRWSVTYMLPRIHTEAGPLIEYTEPINSRISRKARALDPTSQKRFLELRKEYAGIATIALPFSMLPLNIEYGIYPNLPLRDRLIFPDSSDANIPTDLLDAVSLHDFLDILCMHLADGIKAFDQLFGERA